MKKLPYDLNAFKKKLLECQSKMSATLEIITPAVALRYLSSNFEDKENRIQNRELDDKTLGKYMTDMENDRWEVAAPILFDINNKLIDGQGRCTSVVKTGIPIICWVIRGLSENAFSVIDQGKKRTLKDTLTTLMIHDLTGKPLRLSRARVVGTAINMLHNMENSSKHIDKDRYLTTPEITEMVRDNFDYYEEPCKGGVKSKISQWQKRIKFSVPASYFATFYYKHNKTNGNMVDDFLEVITSNDNNTPVIVRKFRDDVLENKSRHVFDKRFLNANAVMDKFDYLFTCYQQGTLNRKKDFPKKATV